jgi:hypothetical protein
MTATRRQVVLKTKRVRGETIQIRRSVTLDGQLGKRYNVTSRQYGIGYIFGSYATERAAERHFARVK